MSSRPLPQSDPAHIDATVRSVLADVLSLASDRVAAMTRESPLFGALPELDSMAVAGLLTELEDRLNILIDDDEIDGDIFETLGALIDFTTAKVGA